MTIKDDLVTLGIPEKCISSRSSAEERGQRFSIRPAQGDEIYCVHVDDCWIGDTQQRVDYLFWGMSASGRRAILLVELKGSDFGRALQQIRATLRRFCKRVADNTVHRGDHRQSLQHDPLSAGGVRAYVVLSKGTGVRQRQRERERIRKEYGVLVYPHCRRLETQGLDALLD